MNRDAISLDDGVMPTRGHVCAFFNSRDQGYRVLLPYIKDGFQRGEKALHFIDAVSRDDHLRRLQAEGISVESAMSRNQLEVRDFAEVFLKGGPFEPNKMLARIEEMLDVGRAQQFPLTRLVGVHMEWAVQDLTEVESFVEFEARLNDLLTKHEDLVICAYDSSKLDGGVVMDLLRMHPVAIIGDILLRNPFYVPPDEFLLEVRKGATSGRQDGVTAENGRLSKTIRDLVILSGISAAWVEQDCRKVAEGMAGMLMGMLRLAAAHVRLASPGECRIDVCHCEDWPEFTRWLENPQTEQRILAGFGAQPYLELPTERGVLYVTVKPIGMSAKEAGFIAVATQRPEFPTERENLLLSVAVNQALLSFENARAGYERRRAEGALLVLEEEFDRASMAQDIVGSSPALQAVLSQIAQVAPTDSTVLITGETGSGKERVARTIHRLSPRADGPFISVNCAALLPSLTASELFGHEKGAFTGAHQRRLGRFELAEGGTLFLDEVGDLPAETQILLLRVLQEREFERVGGNHPISANVRVIAATNRNLQKASVAGTFRSDLFYRLNVFPIEIPPLRERKEDIPALVAHFVNLFAGRARKEIKNIDDKSRELLQSYDWPGNIRELQNVIERAVIVSRGETLSVNENWFVRDSIGPSRTPLNASLLGREKEIIERALADSKGRVAGPSGAAAKLAVPPSTLDSKIKSLRINKYRFKDR